MITLHMYSNNSFSVSVGHTYVQCTCIFCLQRNENKQFKCIKCNCKVEYEIEYEISPFLMYMMANNAKITGILCF